MTQSPGAGHPPDLAPTAPAPVQNSPRPARQEPAADDRVRGALSVGVRLFEPSPESEGDDEPDALTFATDRVAALTKALAHPAFGYHCTTLTGEGREEEPTAAQLGKAVHDVLTTPGRDQVRIVHVISHGVLKPTGLYVLGGDGVHTADTSVAGWLSAVEDFPGRPLVLFLLDLCHSGVAARLEWQLRAMLDGSNRAWVMAASAGDQLAVDGRFTQAVADVLAALAEKRIQYDPAKRHVRFHWFADEVRRRLSELVQERDGLDQRVTVSALDGIGPELPFLPNPGYASAPSHALPSDHPVDGAPEPFLDEVADPDHFRRHAQGGAGFPARPGDDATPRAGLFTGRAAEIDRLAHWLAAGPDAPRLLVVTGSPGAGKSALLGVVLCAAHPHLREASRTVWEPLGRAVDTDVPPIAVHARQRTLVEIVDSLIRRTGARESGWGTAPGGPEGDPRRLFEVLSRRSGPPPALIVDALDEAREPGELVRDLFRPLTTLDRPDGAPLCRVLLATRDEGPCSALITEARATGDVIDLDTIGREALEGDLREYVGKLLGPDAGEAGAAFAAGTAHALADPDRVATTGPHLMAALYTSYALQDDVSPALRDPGSARELGALVPLDLPGLLELGFARDHAHQLLRPVLTALAFAQGEGMPVALVAAVARAFAPPSASDDQGVDTAEVARLLDDLRAFLRAVPDRTGTVLHRLLHQSVADELRRQAASARGPAPREDVRDRDGVQAAGGTAEPAVYTALIDSLRGTKPGGPPRWDGLDDYLRRHLAQHAVDAGRFDELCAEPEFLVHADPDWLGPELERAASESARSAAAVYRTSVHVHRRTSDEQRRHILAVDAVRHEARTLADRLAQSAPGCGPPMPWRPHWATGSRISAAHAFTLYLSEDRVTALAGAVAGMPVVVTGARSGRLRVWDARNGRVLASLDPGLGEIRALACAEPEGTPVVLVAAADGTLALRTLPDLAPWGAARRLFEGSRAVRAAACTEVVGRPMAVTADVDGRLRLWDLLGELPGEELRADLGRTTALVCVPGEDGSLVVVGDEEGTLRFCSPLGGPEGVTNLQHPGRVYALTHAVVGGRPCVVSGGEDGRVRIWDARARTLRAVSAARHDGPVYALARIDDPHGGARVLSGGSDGTIRVWDPEDGAERGRFVGHMGAVTALAHPPSRPPVLVSAGMDPALRVWHVPPEQQRSASAVGHTSWVNALALTAVQDRPVVVSAGADGVLHRWDLERGTPYGSAVATSPDCPHTVAERASGTERPGAVHALAVTAVRGRPLMVAAGTDGQLRAWDVADATPHPASFGPATAPVHAMAATVLGGRPLVVSGGADGLLHIWDVTTGLGRGLALSGHTGGINALACVDLDDRPTALSCGDDGTLRLWDLTTGLPACPPVAAHKGWATALACAVVDGSPLAVTGGQDGMVRVWDLARPDADHAAAERVRPLGDPLMAAGGVNAVACGTVGGTPVVAAADDCAVRVWDLGERGRETSVGVPGAVPALLLHEDRLVLGCEWEVVVLRHAV